MRSIPRRLISANALAFALLCSVTSHAQSDSPPPLQAHEAIVKTKDGCGIVVAAEAAQYVAKSFAAIEWSGVCVEGLAMGQGQGQSSNSWMYWGRRFGLETITDYGETHTYFHWDGKTVQVDQLSDLGAHWPAEQKSWDDSPVVYRMFRDVDGNMVFSQKMSCIIADIGAGVGAIRGCTIKKPFGIFHIDARLVGAAGVTAKSVLCPNPRTPKGCDALWQQVAGPYFERTQSFIADNTPKVEALKREMPTLIANAQSAALVAGRQRAAAARRKEAEDKRLAAVAAAEVARAAQQEAAEERQLKQMLERSSAGQLFTLADKLSAEGKTEEAREVRRVLISRYPDHALAATAATQLANSGSAGNGTAAASSATASSGSTRTGPTGKAQNSIKLCEPDPSLMADFLRYQNAFYERTGGMAPGAITVLRFSPEQARKMFIDYQLGNLDAHADSVKDFIARQEKNAAQPIDTFPPYMDGATQHTAAQLYIQVAGCLLRQIEAGASTPEKVASVSGSGAACALSPQESLRNFNGEMQNFGGRYPNQADRGGSRDQYQYMLFYGTSGLPILEKYRSCMAPADYQANKKALEDARDAARVGCEKLSTSEGSCTADYPSNWR